MSLYNPYNEYNRSINQTNYPIGNAIASQNNNIGYNPSSITQPYIPSNNINPPISSNGNPIVLANTYLPRSYYDDIIDNLELISLNMINDLKVLIKNQKSIKVTKFDTSEFISVKDAVKDQIVDVKDYREKQKQKILDEFAKSKDNIKSFMNEKFRPAQKILEQFSSEIKRDRLKFDTQISECEENLSQEDISVRELLLACTDYYVRTAAQKVLKPNEQSDLENALKLKSLYGDDEDKRRVQEALEDAKKAPINIMIDNSPDEIEQMLQRQRELDDIIRRDKERFGLVDEEMKDVKDKEVGDYDEKEFSENCQSEREKTDDDEDELREKTQEELNMEMDEQLRKAKALLEKKKRQRKFKVLATMIFAAKKLDVIKDEKRINRIKDFNKDLLSIEEYLDRLLDEFIIRPKENISLYKIKIDLTLQADVEKLEEFMKSITDALIIKTTKVKIGKTVSLFFKRCVFDLDIVQPSYLSLYIKKRILYTKGKELSDDQKRFVLVMKVIVGILIYDNLLREVDEENPVKTYNFKLIATIFYYSIIVYYCNKYPKYKKLFNNEILDDEIITKYKPDFKAIEENYYKKLLTKYLEYKRKMNNTLTYYKEVNAKNIVTYNPDTLSDEIEEISRLLLPFEDIKIYLEMRTDYDIMEALEIWANHTIEIIEAHCNAYILE